MCVTKFHTHIKKKAKYTAANFNLHISGQRYSFYVQSYYELKSKRSMLKHKYTTTTTETYQYTECIHREHKSKHQLFVTTYTKKKYWKIFDSLLPKEGDMKNIRTQKQLT